MGLWFPKSFHFCATVLHSQCNLSKAQMCSPASCPTSPLLALWWLLMISEWNPNSLALLIWHDVWSFTLVSWSSSLVWLNFSTFDTLDSPGLCASCFLCQNALHLPLYWAHIYSFSEVFLKSSSAGVIAHPPCFCNSYRILYLRCHG